MCSGVNLICEFALLQMQRSNYSVTNGSLYEFLRSLHIRASKVTFPPVHTEIGTARGKECGAILKYALNRV